MTDQTMPAMTGDSLARSACRSGPTFPLFSAPATANRFPKKSASMGIRAYLLKPLSRRVLAETIRKVLEQRAAALPC